MNTSDTDAINPATALALLAKFGGDLEQQPAHALPAPAELETVQREGEASLFATGIRGETKRAYTSALRYWDAWHRASYGAPLPLFQPAIAGDDGVARPPAVPSATIRAFLVHHSPKVRANEVTLWMPDAVRRQLQLAGVVGRRRVAKSKPVTDTGKAVLATGGRAIDPEMPSFNTVKQRLDILFGAHRKLGLPSPAHLDPRIGQLLAALRTTLADLMPTALTKKKSPLRAEHIARLVASCTDGIVGVRDRAMLLAAYDSGGRRRSEVISMDVEHLTPFHDAESGLDGYYWGLPRTKTRERQDATTAAETRIIADEAAHALDAWLDVLRQHDITSGPVFRRIGKRRKSGTPRLGARLSDKEYVAEVIVERASRALPDFEDLDLAGHSIRSGFVTEGKKRGIGDSDLMAMSGHEDPRTFAGYYQIDAPVQESARVLSQLRKRNR